MAKKKSGGGFSMAEAIRDILRENRNLTAKEALAALKQKHPGVSFNENSFSVAFYGARNKLGIKSKRRRGKKKRAAGKKKTVVRKTPAASGKSVDVKTLERAAKFVSEVGDSDKAIEAIRQLRTLQIG